MVIKELGPEDWKCEKDFIVRDADQPYLRMYTKEIVDALVTEEAVAQTFKCYTIPYNNSRSERYYVAWVGGRQVAVRGLTHAKFLYLHHLTAEEAAQHTCSFEESYYNTSESDAINGLQCSTMQQNGTPCIDHAAHSSALSAF
jgi:hypothetical protein